MSRRRRRGFNGRRAAPRRKKSKVETPAPVLSAAVPVTRTLTGPRTPQEQAKHAEMLSLIERTQDRLARRDERQRRLMERYADEPMVDGSVGFGGNATDELRHSLNGGQ